MGNTPPGTVRHKKFDPTRGTVEQPDELIYIVRNEANEIMDVGIDEFMELERKHGKYLKLTLIGKDEEKPVVFVIESESKITVREFGVKEGSGSGED